MNHVYTTKYLRKYLLPIETMSKEICRFGEPNNVPTASTAPTIFETYNDFVKYLAARNCPSCSTLLITEPKEVDRLFNKWVNGDRESLKTRTSWLPLIRGRCS
jgi:hypothetical protein